MVRRNRGKGKGGVGGDRNMGNGGRGAEMKGSSENGNDECIEEVKVLEVKEEVEGN